MRCKDDKQHRAMFHTLHSVSSLIFIAQNVSYFLDTVFNNIQIFKYCTWASCGDVNTHKDYYRVRSIASHSGSTQTVIIIKIKETTPRTYQTM